MPPISADCQLSLGLPLAQAEVRFTRMSAFRDVVILPAEIFMGTLRGLCRQSMRIGDILDCALADVIDALGVADLPELVEAVLAAASLVHPLPQAWP